MGIKSKVKSLLQKIKAVSIPSAPPLQPTFSSYKEAEKAAGNYEENELIKVIVAKSVKYKNSLEQSTWANIVCDIKSICSLHCLKSTHNIDKISVAPCL